MFRAIVAVKRRDLNRSEQSQRRVPLATMIRLALLLALAAPAAAVAAPADRGAGDRALLAQATEPEEEAPSPDESEAAPEAEEEPAPADETQAAPETEEDDAAPDEPTETPPQAEEQQAEPAEDDGILRSESAMPEPVRETWRALIEAAESGHIENLRPVIEDQPQPPMLAFDDVGDPIAHLRSLAGDAEGREVLAILLEVLESGFLHVDEGTPQEMYLWPYFARYPIEDLTPAQMVELFTLLTAGDYQDMLSYGAYIFFRVGIAPDGRWLFFIAGD